jgi:hypothetical protein
VTIGATLVLFTEFRGEINAWIVFFGLIAIIFNPLFPIYLGNKSSWMLLDIATALAFLIKAFRNIQPKTEA